MIGIVTKLAWRNLWRQKRRTVITLSSIAIGLGMMIIFVNLIEGMRMRLIKSATDSMIGDGQIHSRAYRQTGDPELWMADGESLLNQLNAHADIRVAAPRLLAPCLAAMGDRASSLTLCGVNPALERQVTNWDDRLLQGTYLDGDNRVLIGKKLADKLELEIDGKLVLTVADLHSGELNSQLVRIGGILATESAMLNEHMVIVPLPLARHLTGLQKGLHEIAMKLDADRQDEAALTQLLEPWKAPELEVVTWQQVVPGLIKGMEFQDLFIWIAFVVVFILAALGIANTMGMSLLERIREFGMLQAIGTTPTNLGGMVLCEYICLGLTGGLLGLGIGLALTFWLGTYGIPLDNVEMVGMVLNEPIYPILDLKGTLLQFTVFCGLVPLLAWLPIRKVLNQDPAASLRFD